MRIPGQIWSSCPFCPPEYWRSTHLSITGKSCRLRYWTVEYSEVQGQCEWIPAFPVWVTELQPFPHIILKWFGCKISLGRNSRLCKILIYLEKEYKVVKGMLASLGFFFFAFSLIGSLITAWFVVIMFACPLLKPMDAPAAKGCLKHLCQLFLLFSSSCFIWLPSHLNSVIYFGGAHVHTSLCHFLSVKTHWDSSFTAIINEWLGRNYEKHQSGHHPWNQSDWMTSNLFLLYSDKAEVCVLGAKHLRTGLSDSIMSLDGITLSSSGTGRNLGVLLHQVFSPSCQTGF